MKYDISSLPGVSNELMIPGWCWTGLTEGRRDRRCNHFFHTQHHIAWIRKWSAFSWLAGGLYCLRRHIKIHERWDLWSYPVCQSNEHRISPKQRHFWCGGIYYHYRRKYHESGNCGNDRYLSITGPGFRWPVVFPCHNSRWYNDIRPDRCISITPIGLNGSRKGPTLRLTADVLLTGHDYEMITREG